MLHFLFALFQGALIGLGAVLPGISGGVLSVVFGIYKPLMELLANPFQNFRTHVPKLFPYLLGALIGFLGIANLLAYFLEKYPSQSICLFVGLIIGMLPSLWEEAGKEGRTTASYLSFLTTLIVVFILLASLQFFSVTITPNFFWYLFCGFTLALSIIAPGMSFSTLLMPLGLYTPFIDGIGHLSTNVLIPGGIGAIVTIVVLSKGVNALFDKHYSIAFHGIVGVVISATVMIIPFESFVLSGKNCLLHLLFLGLGLLSSIELAKFNAKVEMA